MGYTGQIMDEAGIVVESAMLVAETEIRRADLAWMGIAAFVALYDFWAIKNGSETLSRAYWRALRNPKTRWPAVLICTGLYKHLVFPNLLPKTDPFYYVAERWHRNSKYG